MMRNRPVVALQNLLAVTLAWLALGLPAFAQTPDTVFLEELTWTEVRDAIKSGKTTIIFPTGGTEQNGPHMVLGKHNFRIKYTAEQIARRLGNTLVAPVLAYVPEGELDPPTGHMRFPGTITLPLEYFMKVTEYAARSFKVHGFKDIVLIGDSGPNLKGLEAVANTLNKEWAGAGARVHHASRYFRGHGYGDWLVSQGETRQDIGTHAGIADTSPLMAINPKWIRMDKLAPGGDSKITGVLGNPERSSIAYGKRGLEIRIEAALAQIRESMARSGN
jgi:creatinine amidohydrolase/Fe(II)-dependent formamide hydrolase-like protein